MPDAALSSAQLPSHYLSVLRPGDGFVEVGAGDGAVTRGLADQVGPSGRGIAVEHDTMVHRRLRAALGDRGWVTCPEPGTPWGIDGLAVASCRLLRLACADPAAVLAGAAATRSLEDRIKDWRWRASPNRRSRIRPGPWPRAVSRGRIT